MAEQEVIPSDGRILWRRAGRNLDYKATAQAARPQLQEEAHSERKQKLASLEDVLEEDVVEEVGTKQLVA